MKPGVPSVTLKGTRRLLLQRLKAALERRASLWADPSTTAFRWVNSDGDGLPGVTVDRFGEVLCVSFYRDVSPHEESQWVAALVDTLTPKAIYLKHRPKEARVVATTQKGTLAPALPRWGEPVERCTVLEGGLSYLIEPGAGLAVGLYLDMRTTRQWLRAQVRGTSVLNLFAYTCAFGICATAGGATRVLNVDQSRRVLDWGARNAEQNQQPVSPRDYVSGDAFDWLRRLAKKGESFDWVILDPPSFATTAGSRFSAAKDSAALVEAAAPLVSPGGRLLACCNQATLSLQKWELQVTAGLAAAKRKGRKVFGPTEAPLDFPEPPGVEPVLKVRAFELE